MAGIAKTTLAEKICVNETMLHFFIEQQKKINASKKMIALFRGLQTAWQQLLEDSKKGYVRIETKPFYYDVKSKFYFVDAQRYQVQTRGDEYCKSISGVPTEHFVDNTQFSEPVLLNCPMFKKNKDSDTILIQSKNGKKYGFYAYYDGYWKSGYLYVSDDGRAYINYGRRGSNLSKLEECLHLVLNRSTSFKDAIAYNLQPETLTEEQKQVFARLVEYQSKSWLVWEKDVITSFTQEFYTALMEDKVLDLGTVSLQTNSLRKEIEGGLPIFLDADMLLSVDEKRAGLTPYAENPYFFPFFD